MTVVPMDIKPKTETHMHEGHRFTCTYDKNAPTDNLWVWRVAFTRTYYYVGSAPTKLIAERQAKRKIHALNKDTQDMEERGV